MQARCDDIQGKALSMKAVQVKIGDCVVIPLPDGRYAYGQYVHYDRVSQYGYMVRVFDLITEEIVSIARLQSRKILFPPVFVALEGALKTGRWRVIGSLPVEEFTYPQFRVCPARTPGIYHDWELWDGKYRVFLGKLPEKFRDLECVGIWGAEILEERIMTGNNPFEQFR